jgi:hypothetical protein
MSQIFYSEVNSVVKSELNSRAAAGRTDRSTKSLRFMLEKIANVTATAYEGNTLDATKEISTIGGTKVREAAYLPAGFLSRQRVSKRIPPVITSTSISFTDGTMSMLNQAALSIQIPSLEDLEQFESVWCRPGRKVKIEIENPPSSVLTDSTKAVNNITNKSIITSTDFVLESQYLHKLSFIGLIISFDLTINADASVTAMINIKGTGSTYPDLSLLQTTVAPDANSQSTGSLSTSTLVTVISQVVKRAKLSNEDGTLNPVKVALSTQGTLDEGSGYRFGILWGRINDKQYTYISLERLIDLINRYIINNLSSTTAVPFISMNAKNPYETRNTNLDTTKFSINNLPEDDYESCPCVHYPELVSLNPFRVLLWEGNSTTKTCTYGSLRIFDKLLEGRPFSKDGKSSAKQIYIELNVIRNLFATKTTENKSYAIKDFLSDISNEISSATAGAIKMALIIHPEDQNVLVYYDTNFNGTASSKNAVIPYPVPTYANDTLGTIVRADGFKITSQLPKDLSALAYTLSNANISDSAIAPHIQYTYAGETTKERLKTEFTKNHKSSLEELIKAKQEYGLDFYNSTKISQLNKALVNYLKYPFSDIEIANAEQGPVFPLDITFVTDGINGLKYCDILEFPALPARYSRNAVFYITNISQDVDSSGDWKTTVTCRMRPKI